MNLLHEVNDSATPKALRDVPNLFHTASVRRVVVTGGAGFLGSHVVNQLERRGYRNVFAPRSAHYDLTNTADVQRLYRDTRPQLVIHLAARVGGIGANQKNAGKFFYDNLMMGTKLLHEACSTNVQKFVAVGTVCCYPKFAPIPFREEDLWAGYPEETNASYGMAKKMLLVQARAYREQYGFNAVNLIPTNLYGPGDNFDLETSHVIPALIRKIDAAIATGVQEVALWGDGTPTRDFLYVEDAARAIVDAAENYDGVEPLNVGSGNETSIAELAGAVGDLAGFSGRFVYDNARPNGQPRRVLDTRRAREQLYFVPQTVLRDGLLKTIDWYRNLTSAGGAVR